MAKILVSNNSNIQRAEILAIVDDKHTLTKNESMKTWIESGGTFETLNRFTSIINIIDKTKEELEYLLEPLLNMVTIEPEILHNRKWYFLEPAKTSELYIFLYSTGEVSVIFNDILPYLKERT